MSTYDFSTLYTTLPHNLIKDKLIDLIERTFQREGSPYLACSDRNAFFTSEKPKKYHAWSCQNVCDALTFLLDNIFIRFGTKLYRQVVGIPMGTNCAPLVADLFLFCYERDFMMSLSDFPPVKYFTDRSKAVLLLWIFYVFVLSCVCYVLCASVYMCFVVTCWERADLLALVCGVFCEFVTFPLVSWVRCGT